MKDWWFIKKSSDINGTHMGYDGWDDGFKGPLSKSRAAEISAVIGGQRFRFRMPKAMAENMMNQVKAQYKASREEPSDMRYNEMIQEMNREGYEWERKVDNTSPSAIQRVYENSYQNWLTADEPTSGDGYPDYYDMLEEMRDHPTFDHKEVTEGSRKSEDIQKAWDVYQDYEEPETIEL